MAVTGDGVNDAPALHAADVAVAMGSGTAVAKEASDLVLGDDSFATLVYGIDEGRRIVDNVQKGLVFLVSTHVALLGFILIATLAGFSQPLLPIQILWLELFIDLSASVAFEREPAEPDIMTRPPRPAGRPLLTRDLLARIAGAGGFSAVAALWLMTASGGGSSTAAGSPSRRSSAPRPSGPTRTAAWRCRSTSLRGTASCWPRASSPSRSRSLIPFVPPLADAFRASPLATREWVLVAGIALAPAVVAEIIRRAGRGPWVA